MMTINREKIKILLIEDDVNLGFLLVDFLESNGYEVKLYRDGESGLNGFMMHQYDFCILDIMLPRMDGYAVLERIKKINARVPVMLLSAKSMKDDKIKGFCLGTDDYLTKPFDEEELLYRVKAILNRTKYSHDGEEDQVVFKIGNYEFNLRNQQLKIKNNCQRLTLKESGILRLLCNSKNSIVRREEIMLNIWGESDYYTGRSLDVHISKLRSYLKDDPSVRISTIPTVGYNLEIKS